MDRISFSITEFGSDTPSSRIDMVGPDGGINLWVLGMLVTMKALGNSTRGVYGLMEHMIPPGCGPPVHLHLHEEESWYLLDGELIWTVKGQEFHAKPGAFIHLPRLIAHTFANKFDSPAHMLVSISPAGLEKWYLDVGRPVIDIQESPPAATKDDLANAIFKAMNYGVVFSDHIEDPPMKFFS